MVIRPPHPSVSSHTTRKLIERSTVLMYPPRQMDAELCSNKKMIDESRFLAMHSCGVFEKSFQSHPVIWAQLDHLQPNPVILKLSDFCQPDVDKGLLAF